MALIENLERDDWEKFFRDCFRYTLEVLKADRFRSVGSSVDDLKSWLTAGGVARIRYYLGNQMEMQRFSPNRKAAINSCIEQLVKEHRGTLFDLMAKGIIPGSTQECLTACGFSEAEFNDLLDRLARGERPFEEWMYARGHSEKEVTEIYHVIDSWLLQVGITPPPFCPSD
jgi:hypothetical protein